MITAFCLALAIHFEARGEPIEGQLMVARTVVNRAAHPQFPDDECSVIYQRGQFPWARDEIVLPEESLFYDVTLPLAEAITEGEVPLPDSAALFFHADYASPYWAAHMTHEATVGHHLFYAIQPFGE